MSVTLHTDLGDIKLELYCQQCPKTCENFLALAASGRYNNTIFHRNIPGFMVQGGDPTNSGKGGMSIWGEPFEDEFQDSLTHNQRGILSMANGGPNTNKSQFFLTYAKHPSLDMKYTIFGRMIDGDETLDAIEKVLIDPKTFRPTTEIKLRRCTIHANPIADLED